MKNTKTEDNMLPFDINYRWNDLKSWKFSGKTDDELLQEFLNADLSELELGSAIEQTAPTSNSGM